MTSAELLASAAAVLGALGALVVCALTFRYGFTLPPEDDEDVARRWSPTRVGHGIAASCFAGAAVLAMAGLAMAAGPVRHEPAGPDPAEISPIALVSRRVGDVESRVRDVGSRIEATLARLEHRWHRMVTATALELPERTRGHDELLSAPRLSSPPLHDPLGEAAPPLAPPPHATLRNVSAQ